MSSKQMTNPSLQKRQAQQYFEFYWLKCANIKYFDHNLSAGDAMFLGNHIIVSFQLTRKENPDNNLVIIVMDGLIVNVTSFLETLNVHNIHFGIKKPILRLFRNVRYKKMESVLAVSFFKVELKLKLNRHISQGVSSLYICDQSLRKSTTNTERIFIIIQCI